MSKGTKEKESIALVMSRNAKLFILDEPIASVDSATRAFLLDIILENFNEEASLIISTHLICYIEGILDEVIFIDNGKIILHEDSDFLRTKHNKSIDSIFREVFKCY